MQIKKLGEAAFIKQLAKTFDTDGSVIEGIGDDAAVIKWTKDKYLLFASDMLIEGVHFYLKDARPFQVGWKALAVNLSDIAAMGGVGRYAVVSMGVDPDTPARVVKDITKGIKVLAETFGVNIVGGDTNASKRLVIDVAILGEVKKDRLVTRKGARAGDLIIVTGEIGAGRQRHLDFVPRLDESSWLTKKLQLHSMIDISDGLILDLSRILSSSKKGARIYEKLIPVSRYARSFDKAITDGEDFELLFTMRAKEAARFFKKFTFQGFKTPVSIIGQIVNEREGFTLMDRHGKVRRLKPSGFTHF